MTTPDRGRDWVALILAIGIATALNCIAIGVLYDALASSGPGLSENATQILTGAFGGILGVLGSYIGFRAASDNKESIDRAGNSEVESDRRATGPETPQPIPQESQPEGIGESQPFEP